MSAKEEFRRYLRAATTMPDNPHGSHPDERDLIACCEGHLASDEQEKIQIHLAQCRECLQVYRDIMDFFAPPTEAEPARGEVEVRRAWNAFQQRMKPEDATSRLAGVAPSVLQQTSAFLSTRLFGLFELRFTVQTALATAAMLLLVVGLTGGWALWLNNNRQQLSRQLSEARSQAAQVAPLLEEHRELQAQVENLKRGYESKLADLQKPQLNASVFDVFPEGVVQRSGSGSTNQLAVPAEAREFTLVLNGEGVPKHPRYTVEISRYGGEVLWRGEGLQQDGFGSFFIRVHQSFMNEGAYLLKLYGGASQGFKPIARYRLNIRILPQ